MNREIRDDILPQHDLDHRRQIRWEITQKGRRALELERAIRNGVDRTKAVVKESVVGR